MASKPPTLSPPEARTLLPPLLACLPTAFVSPHPPPSLLPLLSPILRQRVSLLSGNTGSGNGGWLSLLSWDPARAPRLGKHVEGVHFEAHPVSGELEIEDPGEVAWRRLDEETLQCRFEIDEFGLLPVYLWVENDEVVQDEGTAGPGGAGWKLAELRVLSDREDGTEWYPSQSLAESAFASSRTTTTTRPQQQPPVLDVQDDDDNNNDDDDDDYWNAYDRTPGLTPARTPAKHSPAPRHAVPSNLRTSSTTQIGPTAEELEYFARYATEVQPALDAHDPDEENEEFDAGGSTLHGDALTRAVNPTMNPLYDSFPSPTSSSVTHTAPQRGGEEEEVEEEIQAPRATSPTSTASIEKLESSAAAGQASRHASAETGVRQFISTEIKSLFRLARSVGIDRDEFADLVDRELGVLGMLEGDE